MAKLTRRNFIKSSLATAAGVTAATGTPRSAWSRTIGANDQVRIGVIGTGSMGRNHVRLYRAAAEKSNCKVVAICDVDTAVSDRCIREEYEEKEIAEKPKVYRDYLRLLEDKNIDAVSIATPHHWHALMTIHACQAGKDVYVEKPVCHNIWEGVQMVKAARKYNRIVQSGTQMRSSGALKETFEYINSGELGKIKMIHGLCYNRRKSNGKVTGPQPIPDTMDFNLWTGPAPLVPLRRRSLRYAWHWMWDTGNGDLGNQGIHYMDVTRWASGYDKLPERVISIGGRLGYDDDGETANTQIIYFDYKPVPIIFEVRGLPMNKEIDAMDSYRKGVRGGVVVDCEKGYFAGCRKDWIYDNDGNKIKRFIGGGAEGHTANFISAIRTRQSSDLHADIQEGFLSSSLCHLGTISNRIGQKASPQEIREAISGNDLLLESFDRMEKHLLANEVDLTATPLTLGADLKFDPDNYKFVAGAGENEYGITRWANELLTRPYRKPFVVPEKV